MSYAYERSGMGLGRGFLKTNQQWLIIKDAERYLAGLCGATNVTIINYQQIPKEEYDFHINHEK